VVVLGHLLEVRETSEDANISSVNLRLERLETRCVREDITTNKLYRLVEGEFGNVVVGNCLSLNLPDQKIDGCIRVGKVVTLGTIEIYEVCPCIIFQSWIHCSRPVDSNLNVVKLKTHKWQTTLVILAEEILERIEGVVVSVSTSIDTTETLGIRICQSDRFHNGVEGGILSVDELTTDV